MKCESFLIKWEKCLKFKATKYRVNENIIIFGDLFKTYWRPIGDLSETHWRQTCFIGDPLETSMSHWRPIRDRHVSPETHRRPTCLIGDLSEANMPHWRPIGDPHASLKTNMPHWRPTCLIGDPPETDMPNRRPTCLIGDRHASSKTNMPHGRPIRNTYLASFRVQNFFILHGWWEGPQSSWASDFWRPIQSTDKSENLGSLPSSVKKLYLNN